MELNKVKDDLEWIRLDNDSKGYVSTNDADLLIKHCESLIAEIERLRIVEQAYAALKKAL